MEDHTLFLCPDAGQEKSIRVNEKAYPMKPHIGTGIFNNIEYGLWDTVSQFMARDMAQKL
jgi:hypothetical protein